MPNPSLPLWVACMGDPAIERTKPGTAAHDALLSYAKGREIADLARVTLRDGQVPVLVELAPLTARLRAAALGFRAEPQRGLGGWQCAARRVLLAWASEGGAVTGSAEELDVSEGVLTEKGVARLMELVGGDGIEELGSLAIQRATVHPRALAPFVLPSPSGGV